MPRAYASSCFDTCPERRTCRARAGLQLPRCAGSSRLHCSLVTSTPHQATPRARPRSRSSRTRPPMPRATPAPTATRSDVSETAETFVPPPCETVAPTSCPYPCADLRRHRAHRGVALRRLSLRRARRPLAPEQSRPRRGLARHDPQRDARLPMPPPEEHVPMTTDERMQLVRIRCGMIQ